MTLINHPNVLRSYCSFTAGHSLWVVMPYMAGGSCLHIMKSSYPEGFEEPVIATLLREVLKALVYIHYHGHIHRDVKVHKAYLLPPISCSVFCSNGLNNCCLQALSTNGILNILQYLHVW